MRSIRECIRSGFDFLIFVSCDTPIVTTPVGADLEVLSLPGEEFFCQDITPETITDRITGFLKQDIWVELRRYCRNYCESNFNIEKIVASIENILKSAAGSNVNS